VQNILARVVVRASWTVSSLDIRRDLHWLSVSHRATFKLCLITWKTFHIPHTAHPPHHPLPFIQGLTFFQHKFSGYTPRHY